MSAKLHLARPDDFDRVAAMVSQFQTDTEIEKSAAELRSAILPLLEGSPHGAVWLIGPRRAPVGYICVCFGWSLEFGGLDGFIDEIFIRKSVRGRGMGTEALIALLPLLAEAGVKALHLEVDRDNKTASRLYQRLGFKLRDSYNLMSWVAADASAT